MLEGREWTKVKGASAEEIERLRAIAPALLPESYYSLLSFSNGGEGPLPVQPLWFCVYPIEDVIQIEQSGRFREYFPRLFVIGGNGGLEAVAFDLRWREPYPLVMFDVNNPDFLESVQNMATSFDTVLELIGRRY